MKVGSLVKLEGEMINGQSQFVDQSGIIVEIGVRMRGSLTVNPQACYVYWPGLDSRTLTYLPWMELA